MDAIRGVMAVTQVPRNVSKVTREVWKPPTTASLEASRCGVQVLFRGNEGVEKKPQEVHRDAEAPTVQAKEREEHRLLHVIAMSGKKRVRLAYQENGTGWVSTH